jgi:hypothetical protein
MEVEDVHLDSFHAVEIALEDVSGNKVAADVNQETAPQKAGLVFDGHGGSSESIGCDSDELKEGF